MSTKYDWVAGGILKSMKERFLRRIGRPCKNHGCLPWTGAYQSGYGSIGIPLHRGFSIYTNRFAWFLKTGTWPQGDEIVCHSCHHRWCVDISHLYLGDYHSNALDHQVALDLKLADGPCWHECVCS